MQEHHVDDVDTPLQNRGLDDAPLFSFDELRFLLYEVKSLPS